MSILVYMIPIALTLGFSGLVAFLWALKNGQFEDLDGASHRMLRDDDEAYTEPVRDDLREALPDQPLRQSCAQGRARKGAREHADERDADLDGGEEAAGIIGQAHRGLGAFAALIAEDFEACGTGGDNRELGHGKQTVDDGQGHDDQNFG